MRGDVLPRENWSVRQNQEHTSISQLPQVCDFFFFFPHNTKIAYDFGTDARSGICEDVPGHTNYYHGEASALVAICTGNELVVLFIYGIQ